MSQYRQTRHSLDKHRLAPKKRFGQNFLVNKHTAQAIVHAGSVTPSDIVVEVGVGLGALTRPLAAQARKVIGLEIDSGIIRFHEEECDLPANVTLIHGDVLKVNFEDLAANCGGPLKIMANLPYSISNPFIFKLIENRGLVADATIMLQKEVAERLMARPGTKEYGVPSVLLQSCAELRKVMTLKPAEFHPRPKIDSVVVRITFRHTPCRTADGTSFSFDNFTRIVRTAFNQRRKTILNTLSMINFFAGSVAVNPSKNKELTEQAILDASLSPSMRPEVLTVEDFSRLTGTFEKLAETVDTTD